MSFDDYDIVVVDSDEEFLAEAKTIFEGGATTAHTVADAQRLVEAGDLDLLVLGPSNAHEAALESFSLLLELDSDLPVVLATGTITAQLLRAALRYGLRDVIQAPFTAEEIHQVLRESERRSKRRLAAPVAPVAPVGPKAGRVITVASAKGGSGKTVTATNLALLLARAAGPGKVAIVDADLQFGDVCLVLQLEPKLTIFNAAQDIDRLDNSLIDSLLTKHVEGVSVLAAPLEPAFADEVSTAVLIEVVSRLRERFEYVVVDTASLLDELLLSLLERADDVIFIVDMDLPSVKNAKLALETLRLLKFPSSKIKVVLNRSNSRARLDEGEIERSLKMKISASIPSDGLVPASVNEGRPVVLSAPRSKVAKGFESVAALILGEVAESAKTSKKRWK
ncbi:MAG: AAA family ATPase [Acidimicrobiia bacterium]|nr:AAA family ATPase [Acidimicrobiia bacterium]